MINERERSAFEICRPCCTVFLPPTDRQLLITYRSVPQSPVVRSNKPLPISEVAAEFSEQIRYPNLQFAQILALASCEDFLGIFHLLAASYAAAANE